MPDFRDGFIYIRWVMLLIFVYCSQDGKIRGMGGRLKEEVESVRVWGGGGITSYGLYSVKSWLQKAGPFRDSSSVVNKITK